VGAAKHDSRVPYGLCPVDYNTILIKKRKKECVTIIDAQYITLRNERADINMIE
jgi:hypothetical protein